MGLGLAGTRGVTLQGFDAVREADVVFAEFYTSRVIGATQSDLEDLFARKLSILNREEVEQGSERLLDAATRQRVAFLTGGDPLTATTHQELRDRAIARGIATRVVHGVSIQTAAAGAAGLQSYKFGRTTTLVFPQPNYRPASPYENVAENLSRGLHTLVLLDLRAEEEKFMTAAEGTRLLLEFEKERGEHVVEPNTLIIACARVGSADERVLYAPAEMLVHADLGPPLHCLIVPGKLHFAEETALKRHRANPALFNPPV